MNQIAFPNTFKPWSTEKTNLESIFQDSCKINISCKFLADTIISYKSLADQINSCKMLARFLQEMKGFSKKLARKKLTFENFARNMLALKFQFIGLRVEKSMPIWWHFFFFADFETSSPWLPKDPKLLNLPQHLVYRKHCNQRSFIFAENKPNSLVLLVFSAEKFWEPGIQFC